MFSMMRLTSATMQSGGNKTISTKALRLLARAAILLTAGEGRGKTERETMETSTLREYTVLFAIVSELYRRFDPHVHRRADRADVDQKESIGLAIHTRREGGGIDRTVSYLHSAMTSSRRDEMVDRRDEMVEETFGPQLEQLRQWYDVVARGVEPGSEAHDCLERFVVAVDVFNDSTARDDTDHIIKTFDAAVALLKDAASARPRR